MKKMFIPAGPLPALKDVLRISFGRAVTRPLPWKGGEMTCYRLGRLALMDGVRKAAGKRGGRAHTAWFPDYFCEEALLPLRSQGFKLVFYPVGKDLSPCWDEMERAVRKRPPDVLVITHYFGFPNMLGRAREFSARHGLSVIEDAAHVLVPNSGIGEENMTIYSPRKILPLPGGGILVAPASGKAEDGGSVNRGPAFFMWAMKSMVKIGLYKMGVPWKDAAPGMERPPGQAGDNGPARSYARALSALAGGLDKVVLRRRENFRYLLAELRGLGEVGLPFQTLPEGVCPYAFPLFVNNRDRLLKRLHSSGVPARSWPDLPGEVFCNKSKHGGALWLEGHLMLLPVHQGLGPGQMEAMAGSFKEALARGGRP